jgi:C4-dicarboxylate-binding protein DctP
MGIIYGGAMTGQVPTIDVFDIPFVFSDYRTIQKLWHGPVGDVIRDGAAQVGIRILSFGAYGDSFAVINNVRPLRMPADFAGLKLRGNTPVSTEALKALGAAPVGMAAAEVYAAIERGTIDGAATGLGTIVSRKWLEVSKYATFTASSYSVWPVMINAKRWEALPEEVRTALQEAATAIENELIAAVEKEDSEYAEQIRRTLDVHVLSPAESEVWRAALAPVEAAYRARTGDAGAAILQQARK